ncbi:MAG: hypothetical protein JWR83_2818 [Aeromicrobium sp.]|nr:hypothetical protein [Aeromicrobium sp.]
MNEQEATTYVGRLAETIPDRPAPVTDLIRDGEVAKRRRNRRTVLGAIVAAVLVIAGGAVAQQALAGGNGRGRVPKLPEASTPQVPDGMRLVGIGRAVVAVPASWPVIDSDCEEPQGDHVFHYSDSWSTATCHSYNAPKGVSVGIGSLDSRVGRELLSREPDTTDINGVEVIDGGRSCGDTSPYFYCTETFAVSSENVFFSVTVKQHDAEPPLVALRDSLQLLPEGYIAVPFAVGELNGLVGNQLVQLGLVPDDVGLRAGYSGRETVIRTSPEGGTVVQIGDTVHLFLNQGPDGTDCAIDHVSGGICPVDSGGSPAMTAPIAAEPGEVIALGFPKQQLRGADFRLASREEGRWVDAYQLISTQNDSVRPPWRPLADALPVGDRGIGGPGPDFVTIPDTANAGIYRLCTANAQQQACAVLTVEMP